MWETQSIETNASDWFKRSTFACFWRLFSFPYLKLWTSLIMSFFLNFDKFWSWVSWIMFLKTPFLFHLVSYLMKFFFFINLGISFKFCMTWVLLHDVWFFALSLIILFIYRTYFSVFILTTWVSDSEFHIIGGFLLFLYFVDTLLSKLFEKVLTFNTCFLSICCFSLHLK